CDVRDVMTGRTFTITARVLVNACGPYADRQNGHAGITTSTRHVFSKGIHLIVDRLTPSRRVLTFFADDGRMFFVIPMGARSVIGTTDTRVDAPETSVTPEDRRFVLDNINKRLRLDRPLTEADVIAERCGVRPLAVTPWAPAVGPWGALALAGALLLRRSDWFRLRAFRRRCSRICRARV
ncbi:MAG: FAD-dependent oxidoreductase, partial [Gammaproteobacteria bacterium]|nr:FAD-dependent oxidoreductase [Gammaproteobacteria bacterium]